MGNIKNYLSKEIIVKVILNQILSVICSLHNNNVSNNFVSKVFTDIRNNVSNDNIPYVRRHAMVVHNYA